MEPITVWRGAASTDDYGNPIQGDPAPLATFSALVAPKHDGETSTPSRYAGITGYQIFIEDQGPTGIRPTDLIEVRSPAPAGATHAQRRAYLLPVDGIVGEWRWRDGRHKGDELHVKVVEG